MERLDVLEPRFECYADNGKHGMLTTCLLLMLKNYTTHLATSEVTKCKSNILQTYDSQWFSEETLECSCILIASDGTNGRVVVRNCPGITVVQTRHTAWVPGYKSLIIYRPIIRCNRLSLHPRSHWLWMDINIRTVTVIRYSIPWFLSPLVACLD
jgi:hypothetical protein